MASGHANTRGEGAGLSAPAAAAKEEQLAQHREPLYQAGGRAFRNIEWRGAAGRGWLGGWISSSST
jgi:hypothetical protein